MDHNPSRSQHIDTTKLTIQPAALNEVPVIKSMVDAAYTKYIIPMGMIPAAMITDYGAIVDAAQLSSSPPQTIYTLRTTASVTIGAIILSSPDPPGGSIMVSNLVVSPELQGQGLGRLLMTFAEQRALDQGLKALTLFTNEKMVENIGWYTKTGFRETERKTVDGFKRIYFRKDLNVGDVRVEQ